MNHFKTITHSSTWDPCWRFECNTRYFAVNFGKPKSPRTVITVLLICAEWFTGPGPIFIKGRVNFRMTILHYNKTEHTYFFIYETIFELQQQLNVESIVAQLHSTYERAKNNKVDFRSAEIFELAKKFVTISACKMWNVDNVHLPRVSKNIWEKLYLHSVARSGEAERFFKL